MAVTQPDFIGHDARRQVDPWEPWRFTVLLGFLSVICLNPAIFQSGGGTDALTEGSLLNQTLWIALLLVSFVTMQDGWQRVRFQFSPSLLLALAWMLLSVWPSLAPDISIRRYILTVIVIAVTILCTSSPRDDNAFVKAIVIIAILEIALKYIVVFGMPSIGVHSANGKEPHLAGLWRGHYGHKNAAGAICVMQIFAFIAMRKRIPFLYLMIPIVLDLVFLIKAGSKTSIGLVVVAMMLTAIIARTRGFLAVTLLISSTLIGIMTLTVMSIYSATAQELSHELVGDVTFTGRTVIWRFLIDYVLEYPWLGSGFQSFWLVGPVSPALQDGRDWLVGAGHGHQGYLDIAAATGLPGLLLAGLFVIVRPIQDIARVRARHDPVFKMYLAFWIFGLLHNATETSIFDRASVVWVFMLIGICGIRRAVWRESRSDVQPAIAASPAFQSTTRQAA